MKPFDPQNPPGGVVQGEPVSKNAKDDSADAWTDFVPLSADEAQLLRRKLSNTSLLRVVMAQGLVGLMVAGVAFGLTSLVSVAWSALYGAFIVAFPAAIFARGLWRMRQVKSPLASAVGLGVWEGVKLLLTLLGLVLAPWVVDNLNWPTMLVSLLLTMKVYWVALVWRRVFAPN